MCHCPGVFGVLAIDVLVQAAWGLTWHGWFWAEMMPLFICLYEKEPRKPQWLQFWKAMKNPSLFACLPYLPYGSQHIALSGLSLTKHIIWTKLIFSFYRSLPVVKHPRFANWLTFQIHGFSQHLLPFEIVFPVPCPGRARCWRLHVLTWPRQSYVIWLQGAQFWCNYTSFELLTPWKIFTQVSHNHSGSAVDTELHTAHHTPAVGYIIFLQRCSGDTSVSSLAHQLMKFGWMKTTWLCIMKGFSIIFIKKCTLSFNFYKIPKIISDELELVPLFLSCIFCRVLCILCMCYEPCDSFRAF